MTMFIGLHGRAQAGKDTVAAILARQGYVKVAFATPIKDALVYTGLVRREQFEGPAKEKPLPDLGVSPRQLMQTLGTEWGRKLVREDLWICLVDRAVQQYLKFTKHIVITDVRFENEADYVRRMGGGVWHIDRPLPPNVAALHPSEHGIAIWPGVDSWVDNSAGLEQLEDQVRRALAGELIVAGTV